MEKDYAQKLLGSALDEKMEKDTYSYYIEKQWGEKLKTLCDKRKDSRAASKIVNQLIKDFVLAVEAADQTQDRDEAEKTDLAALAKNDPHS
jgi:hypothetical protein